MTRLCSHLRAIRAKPGRRAEKVAIVAEAQEERVRREEIMLEMDWFSPRPAEDPPAVLPEYPAPVCHPPLAPAQLIVIDEADRLKVSKGCASGILDNLLSSKMGAAKYQVSRLEFRRSRR